MILDPVLTILIDRVKSQRATFTPALKAAIPNDQFNLNVTKAQLSAMLPLVVFSLQNGQPGAAAVVQHIDIADHKWVASLISKTASGTKPSSTTYKQSDLLASLFKEKDLAAAFGAIGYDLLELTVGEVTENDELADRNLTWMMVPVTATTARKR